MNLIYIFDDYILINCNCNWKFCVNLIYIFDDYIFLYQGVEAFPIRDGQMFEWIAKLLGPKGTYWEGKRSFIAYNFKTINL